MTYMLDKLFEMEYVDKQGNVLNIDAKNEEGKPILNDGKGTWEFKHRILTVALLATILLVALPITGTYSFFRELSKWN